MRPGPKPPKSLRRLVRAVYGKAGLEAGLAATERERRDRTVELILYLREQLSRCWNAGAWRDDVFPPMDGRWLLVQDDDPSHTLHVVRHFSGEGAWGWEDQWHNAVFYKRHPPRWADLFPLLPQSGHEVCRVPHQPRDRTKKTAIN